MDRTGRTCGAAPLISSTRSCVGRSRHAGRAAHEIRAGDQPQDRESAGADDPAVDSGAGRRSDSVVNRRTFLCGMTLGALSALAAEAQPAKVSRIGILTTGDPGSAPPANWEGFLQGLRESGYVEGQNIAFEHRNAKGKPDLFPDLAADLARLTVDVIFARG